MYISVNGSVNVNGSITLKVEFKTPFHSAGPIGALAISLLVTALIIVKKELLT
jgi:hypothetical protein